MQLALSDARAVRMIQALLAAADPLGRLERGDPPSCYDALAVAVLGTLQDDCDSRRVILLLSEHASRGPDDGTLTLAPIAAFADAVVDWWSEAAQRWESLLAI